MDLILFITIFIVALGLTQMLFILFRSRYSPEVGRLRKEMSVLAAGGRAAGNVDIVKKRTLSEIPWLNTKLLNLQVPTLNRLERFVVQADVKQPLGFFLLLTAACAAVAGALVFVIGRNLPIAILFALLAALVPWGYLAIRKKRRLAQFEQQLPDALDMIARSLRAGHAFTGGMQMVVMEFADPARAEFRKTLDEINFGVSYEDALRSMADRVDCPDLKFFALSVIIQRQSGGNLAEILDKISYLIRERFKLMGKVKALTGEARISAVILSLLPFFMAAVIFFVNRGYLEILVREPVGRIMAGMALVMMVFGIVAMKRMISIKV
ncbi:MAG: type II secretion system F family protein [Syntrophales bacterium]|jgi:tight adherence protein B|nr:type II secretion system F family protein [Syntrophales bacterium]